MRSAELMNYWLACPAANMGAYVVRRHGEVAGYFLISVVEHRARIADLWVQTDQLDLWGPVYAEAFRQAGKLPAVWNVCATTGNPDAILAMRTMGLPSSPNQLFLLDPQRTMPQGLPLSDTTSMSQSSDDGVG